MPTTYVREAEIGEGVYTFPEASRILRSVGKTASARQLRYWLHTGLTPAARAAEGDQTILTFDDLVSLELVRRFKSSGASLQLVRKLDAALRLQYPDLSHPFAYNVFFTDGARIWAEIAGDDQRVVEMVGWRSQYAWRDTIKTFAEEIRFADTGQPQHAVAWNLTAWVEIDPRIQFGMPVVRGTRIPVHTIKANLVAGSPEEVADWYGLTVPAVEGVRDYVLLS